MIRCATQSVSVHAQQLEYDSPVACLEDCLWDGCVSSDATNTEWHGGCDR